MNRRVPHAFGSSQPQQTHDTGGTWPRDSLIRYWAASCLTVPAKVARQQVICLDAQHLGDHEEFPDPEHGGLGSPAWLTDSRLVYPAVQLELCAASRS